MKRIVSLLLALLLLAAALPLSVAAEDKEVQSIEIENPEDLPPLYENVDGAWNSVESYFNYTLPDMSMLRVKIYYTDGSTRTAALSERVDGYSFGYSDNQYTTHWTLGSDNYITVSYLDKTTLLPVTILENPVTSITLNSAPTREYIWGDWGDYGIFYGSVYAVNPSDLTGLSFTVHYQDGGSKTYTAEDIIEKNNIKYIDGHRYSLSCDTWTFEPCSVPVTFTYMGCSFSYTVNYAASSVASVELVRLPDKTEYDYGYHADFVGTQVKITYKNGDTEIVTADDDNLVYDWLSAGTGVSAYIVVDGHWMYFDVFYDSDMTVYYLGASAAVAAPFVFDAYSERSVYLSRVSPDGTGMRITVSDQDGGSDTFTVKPIVVSHTVWVDGDITQDLYDCITRTEKGMLWYRINSYYQGGSLEYYLVTTDFFAYARTVYPGDDLPGDLDCDGRVEADDLVDLRQLLLNGEDFAPADVNGDGKADIRDLIAFKKLLAAAQ